MGWELSLQNSSNRYQGLYTTTKATFEELKETVEEMEQRREEMDQLGRRRGGAQGNQQSPKATAKETGGPFQQPCQGQEQAEEG